MAALSKSGTPSLATMTPGPEQQHDGLIAGEDITAGDACYIKSDGLVWRSTGAAANAAAVVDGFCIKTTKSGRSVSLFHGVELAYGASLAPGTPYYLSGTTAGGLDTATSTGGTVVIARSIDDTRVWVRKSY